MRGLMTPSFFLRLRNCNGIIFLFSSPSPLMNFWTPERCKTIDTLILMDNSCEMSMQAELINDPARKARLLENVEMIQAELRSRA